MGLSGKTEQAGFSGLFYTFDPKQTFFYQQHVGSCKPY